MIYIIFYFAFSLTSTSDLSVRYDTVYIQYSSTKIDSVMNILTDGIKTHESQMHAFREDIHDINSEIQFLNASQDSLTSELESLRASTEHLTQNTGSLADNIRNLNSNLDSLSIFFETRTDQISQELNTNLDKTSDRLSSDLFETKHEFNANYAYLSSIISNNKWFSIIGGLAIILISAMLVLALRKNVNRNTRDLTDKILQNRKELEEETVVLDNKLLEIMQTQLKLMEEANSSEIKPVVEQDHSLAIKVADEIVRIEKNLIQMDENTRGLKQLTKAVERIKANFISNGYEIVELKGKQFNDGMNLIAEFIPDDNLKPGQKIITRIIKPQINYNDKMIQAAHVEVSQGD